MKSLTAAQLKKTLQSMDKENQESLLVSLYQDSAAVKEILNSRLQGDAYALKVAEKYKKKLYRVFYPSSIIRTGLEHHALGDGAICEERRPRLCACLDDIECGWGLEEELRNQYAKIADNDDF